MWSASFLPHIDHVSVSPTNGIGSTQGPRKTVYHQGGNWTHDLRVWSPLLHRLSKKVRREQVVEIEYVEFTAMSMSYLQIKDKPCEELIFH